MMILIKKKIEAETFGELDKNSLSNLLLEYGEIFSIQPGKINCYVH